MVTKMSDSSEEDVELAEAEGSENVSGGEGEREEMEEEVSFRATKIHRYYLTVHYFVDCGK